MLYYGWLFIEPETHKGESKCYGKNGGILSVNYAVHAPEHGHFYG